MVPEDYMAWIVGQLAGSSQKLFEFRFEARLRDFALFYFSVERNGE